ncbi:MAG TPA: hypothetical protein VK131_04995, partial [Candidatus Acidoferrales bacterium]|nr:hypothetical protein [Candidatus Acidoferrales bacterium]
MPLGDWERLRLIKASAKAFIHYFLGDLPQAEEQNREAAAIARLQGMDTHITRHDRWLGLTLAEQGRLEEAGRLLTKPEADWERQNVYFALVGWVRHRLAVGDPQAAADGARPVLLAADRFAALPACLDVAHEAFVAAGRGAEADQLLEAAAGGPHQDAFYHRMRGRSAAAAGAREEAEAALRLALKGFDDAGYRLEAIRTRLLLAEVLQDGAMRDSARSDARALGAWLLAGQPRPEPGIAVRHGGE